MKRFFVAAITAALSTTAIFGHANLIKGHAEQNQQVTFRTEKVAGNVHVLFGSGGNIGLSVGPDGVLMIDTQFANVADRVKAEIAKLSPQKPKFIFNTHWHGDHTGGNEPLGSAGAVIIAHDNVLARMSTEQFMAAFNQRVAPAPAAARPVVTFPTRTTFHLNGDVVQVVHVENAHTDGDSIVHFTNANVIHTGDAYMKDVYPFIDVGSGGSIDGFIASADAVLSRSDASTKIIPGHGALANKADMQRFHDMLVTVRGKIQALIDQGMSENEVVAAKPTAEFDAAWGQGFMNPENFTRFSYQSLTR
jgi:cyclase